MSDLATSLTTALNRIVVSSVVDDVAKLGLKALKKALDDAGFQKMEKLKDYEVFSHVSGNTILFEIVLDIDSMDVPPEKLDEASQSAEILESEIDNLVFRTYGLTKGGDVSRISRMKDARSPVQDARRPARDARRPAGRGSMARKVDHAAAKAAPRALAGMKGIRVTKEGKVSLSFQRTMTKTDEGETKYPEGKFDGVMKDFMDRLKKVISDVFVPELDQAMARYMK